MRFRDVEQCLGVISAGRIAQPALCDHHHSDINISEPRLRHQPLNTSTDNLRAPQLAIDLRNPHLRYQSPKAATPPSTLEPPIAHP